MKKIHGRMLSCLLDNCPLDGEMVDHRKCSSCEDNPFGDAQPEKGKQVCDHPDARRNPHPSKDAIERWESLKAVGSEILTVTLTGRLR